MATAEQYVADSDDEMGLDTSGDEMDDVAVVLTPQEWKAKAGDLYKVRAPLSSHAVCGVEITRQYPASTISSSAAGGDILLPRRISWRTLIFLSCLSVCH